MKLDELLPQQGPMRLVDELVGVEAEQRVRVTARLRDDNPFLLETGAVDAVVAIELVAQASAVSLALAGRVGEGEPAGAGRAEGPRRGLLAGVEDFSFEPQRDAPRAGDVLEVTAWTVRRARSLIIVAGEVRWGGQRWAGGQLKLVPAPHGEAESAPSVASAAAPLQSGGPTSIYPLFERWGRLCEVDEGVAADYHLEPAFPPFRGHYPGWPVLPAVATIALAVAPVRAALGAETHLCRMRSGHFGRAVRPDVAIRVTGKPRSEGVASWSSQVVAGGARAARLVFDVAS